MSNLKLPEMAGLFYPSDPGDLRGVVENFILNGKETTLTPTAIIAPHAGYIYSGQVAGSAYKAASKVAKKIHTVILLSPAHHYPLEGIAIHEALSFETPLGELFVDSDRMTKLSKLPEVSLNNEAFTQEHALEVHLPFIQVALPNAKIVPMLVGNAHADVISNVLFSLCHKEETLIIVSSDLSHQLSYDECVKKDLRTSEKITSLNGDDIRTNDTCGIYPLRGLIHWAKASRLSAHTLDLRNSGDTADPRDQVEGYGAFVFEEI